MHSIGGEERKARLLHHLKIEDFANRGREFIPFRPPKRMRKCQRPSARTAKRFRRCVRKRKNSPKQGRNPIRKQKTSFRTVQGVLLKKSIPFRFRLTALNNGGEKTKTKDLINKQQKDIYYNILFENFSKKTGKRNNKQKFRLFLAGERMGGNAYRESRRRRRERTHTHTRTHTVDREKGEKKIKSILLLSLSLFSSSSIAVHPHSIPQSEFCNILIFVVFFVDHTSTNRHTHMHACMNAAHTHTHTHTQISLRDITQPSPLLHCPHPSPLCRPFCSFLPLHHAKIPASLCFCRRGKRKCWGR